MDLRQIFFIVIYVIGLVLQYISFRLMRKTADMKYWSVGIGVGLATILTCVANYVSCLWIQAENVIAEQVFLSMVVAVVASAIEFAVVAIGIVLKETNEKTTKLKGRKEVLLIAGFLTLAVYLIVFVVVPTIQHIFTKI